MFKRRSVVLEQTRSAEDQILLERRGQQRSRNASAAVNDAQQRRQGRVSAAAAENAAAPEVSAT